MHIITLQEFNILLFFSHFSPSSLSFSFNANRRKIIYYYLLCRYWIFGSVYCTLNNFVSYLSVSCSVFTLLAISADRRRAIVRPLAPRTGRAAVLLVLATIWLGSAAIAAPAAAFSTTVDTDKSVPTLICACSFSHKLKNIFIYLNNIL